MHYTLNTRWYAITLKVILVWKAVLLLEELSGNFMWSILYLKEEIELSVLIR